MIIKVQSSVVNTYGLLNTADGLDLLLFLTNKIILKSADLFLRESWPKSKLLHKKKKSYTVNIDKYKNEKQVLQKSIKPRMMGDVVEVSFASVTENDQQ